jgi:putative ABC transport system permease protein
MIPPRWRKVLADLFSNRVRSILVILSIGIGVFAVGFVTSLYVIILNDLNADYLSVNPSVAQIYTYPFDETTLETVRKMPEVKEAEGRSTVSANYLPADGNKKPITFYYVPGDLNKRQVDRLRPLDNEPLPKVGDHEVLLEKSSMSSVPIKTGDTIQVVVGEDKIRELKVVGYIHDVTGFPYAFSNTLQGYVNANTLEWLGGSKLNDQLVLTVQGKAKDEPYVQKVANSVSEKLQKGGLPVYATIVYHPGEHPVSSIISAMLILLGGLGGLAVFLSAFLVINTLNALLSQHVRQIGMMKAVGATSGQLTVMYVTLVACFGLISLLIALPLSSYVAYTLSSGIAVFFNFRPGPFRIPVESQILQLVVALVIPVAASLAPVISGTRTTIREAISNYGIGPTTVNANLFDRLLSSIKVISRPLIISLRNTFRRKGRLILTLFTLSLGGAIFIAVYNIESSIMVEINKTLGYFLSDINLNFDRGYRNAEITPVLEAFPEIKEAEGWGVMTGQLLSADKTSSVQTLLWAPPAGSKMIKASMSGGRWLQAGDENALVIGNHLQAKRPDLKIGDSVIIKMKNKEFSFKIVGSYIMAGNVEPPFLYVNKPYLDKILNQVDRSFSYRIMLKNPSAAEETRLAKKLQETFKANGIRVTGATTGVENQQQQETQISILVVALLIMAVLIAIVGGLGLMGTMSMNVMERTREIGVMRAIGATDGAIRQLVLVEGMLIGVISWGFGAILATPISIVLGDALGRSMLTVPMPISYTPKGYVIWFVVVVIISALASILPARTASKLTIREVLAYE